MTRRCRWASRTREHLVPLVSSAVARGNSGVLPQREDRPGRLQAGHADGLKHAPGAFQAAPHPRDARAGVFEQPCPWGSAGRSGGFSVGPTGTTSLSRSWPEAGLILARGYTEQVPDDERGCPGPQLQGWHHISKCKRFGVHHAVAREATLTSGALADVCALFTEVRSRYCGRAVPGCSDRRGCR